MAVQEANIREVLRAAVVKGSVQQAIDEFDDPLSDEEKTFLKSITSEELKALRELELRLKKIHESTKGIWGGVVW
jgi:hypothetical protein